MIRTTIISMIFGFCMVFYAQAQSTIYVKWDANGNNNGSSWVNAYTSLQTALAVAVAEDEIWVASGTYTPTTGTDLTLNFAIGDNIKLYGGFNGTETSRLERDWDLNVTVLSGDIGVLGDTSDNSTTVVSMWYQGDGAVLDGFTVTLANGNSGLLIRDSAPFISNCIFKANSSTYGGGIRSEFGANPTVTNCSFIQNVASYFGGGMYNNDSSMKLRSSRFIGNSVNQGNGGGMANNSCPGTLEIVNCMFSGNKAPNYGGAISNWASWTNMINVTISGNNAAYGGAIYNAQNSGGKIRNSIIWGNSSGIYNSQSTPSIIYNILQGGCGSNPLCAEYAVDPMFIVQPDHTQAPNIAGNLRLQPCSPAIDDEALDSEVPGYITTDLDANPRIYGTQVDLGAYEFNGINDTNTVFNCPVDIFVATTPGTCSASNIDLGTAELDSSCNDIGTISNDAPDTFPLGETTVTWTFTANDGGDISCEQLVTVGLTDTPAITAPTNITVQADSDSCTVSNINLGNPGTAACQSETITNNAPETFPLGDTTVLWTVLNAEGHSGSAEQIVTVTLSETPSIICLDPITAIADLGSCSTVITNLGLPTTNNCQAETITNDAPNEFNIGETIVTWTVTNAAGFQGTCEQIITVIDQEAPTINCPDNLVVYNCGEGINYQLPETSDNCLFSTPSIEFTAINAMQTWTVPYGVSSIHIKAWGARGFRASSGKGGFAEGDLDVIPGEVLNVYVGGMLGFNGGGSGNESNNTGGGASDVRINGTSLNNRIIVAGGGGSSSSDYNLLGWYETIAGGDGGGLVGGNGGTLTFSANQAATGGSQELAGAGMNTNPNENGSFGQGGSGLTGGGGGGGWYGGGGGFSAAGGSSYIDGVYNGTTLSGQNNGEGRIIISYESTYGNLVQTQGLPPGSVFPLGTTTNSFTLTDASGLTSSCSFDITVLEDTQAPELIGNLPVGELNMNACASPNGISETEMAALFTDQCHVIVTKTDALTTDICGWTATYSYHVTDTNGNDLAEDIEITYSGSDQNPPLLTGTLPLGETDIDSCIPVVGPSESDIAALYTDDCGGSVTVIKSENLSSNGCDWSVVFNYQIMDVCSNSTYVSITYSGNKDTLNTIDHAVQGLKVISWPNPSNTTFNLKLETINHTEIIKLDVYDITSKKIFQDVFLPHTTFSFGAHLQAGVYFAKLTQANQTQIIRLIKH